MHFQARTSEATRRSGGVLFWLVLSLGMLVSFLALTLDGGRMMEERRHAQASADAAALAAATQLFADYDANQGLDPKGAARAAAVQSAQANGYSNDGNTSIVDVHIPPTSGTFAGKKGFAEVTIQSNLPAGFAAYFRGGDLAVKARSVAVGRPTQVGIICLRPDGGDAFRNDSLATFTLVGSSITVNSTDPQAFGNRSSGILIADSLEIVGGLSNSGGGTIISKIHTGVAPTADPLRTLPVPDPTSLSVRSPAPMVIDSLLPTILKPGIYQGGLRIQGISVVTMLPGIYILEGGGLEVRDSATLIGADVMLYNTQGAFSSGPIRVDSLGKIVLAAPLSGTYQGIAVFQDRALTEELHITGYGTAVLSGVLYVAGGSVRLDGSTALQLDLLGSGIIGQTVRVGGVGSITVNLSPKPPRIADITLVE